MSLRNWTVHDAGNAFRIIGDDGARVEYIMARTDGDERVAFYECVFGGVAFKCRVVDRGDPTVVQPEAMTFIFDASSPSYVEKDVVEAIAELERTISSGRRDPGRARITIERD